MNGFSGSMEDFVFITLVLNGCLMALPLLVMWPVMFEGFSHHHRLRLGFGMLGMTLLATILIAFLCIRLDWFGITIAPGFVFAAATVVILLKVGSRFKGPPTAEEELHMSMIRFIRSQEPPPRPPQPPLELIKFDKK